MSELATSTSKIGGRSRRRWRTGLAVGTAALLVAVGCSSEDSGSSSDSDPTSTTADIESGAPGASNGDLPYARTGWVTLHGDAGNRKYQAQAQPADDYTAWQGLAHQSVLAAPSTGTDGQLFVTTGRAEGASNLHAFDSQGALLWESAPWSGTTGVDSCAVLNTAIVDTDGDLYVSDCDQFWAFHPDGEIKWTATLPTAPDGSPLQDTPLRPNNFVTAGFTEDGAVFGITLFGQVVVFDRDAGEQLGEPFVLPSVPSKRSTEPPVPATMFSDGELDPLMKDPVWQVAFGGDVVSANTPAVSATTGRVFAVTGGADPESGVVYGLDIDTSDPAKGAQVTIAFTTPVGVGSGCSPTLSPDDAYAYTCDAAGTLYSVDTDTGEVQWTADAGSEAGSVAIGPDGVIYLLVRGGTYAAYDPDGTKRWDVDFSPLEDPLPENPAIGPKLLIGGGNPTVIADGSSVVVALNRGYQYSIAGKTPHVPVLAELIEVDAATGRAIGKLADLSNPTEGIIAIRPDGTIVSSQGGITTTSLAPLAASIDALLTDGLTVLPRGGGIEVFTPTS